jgi:hypothetical protein
MIAGPLDLASVAGAGGNDTANLTGTGSFSALRAPGGSDELVASDAEPAVIVGGTFLAPLQFGRGRRGRPAPIRPSQATSR